MPRTCPGRSLDRARSGFGLGSSTALALLALGCSTSALSTIDPPLDEAAPGAPAPSCRLVDMRPIGQLGLHCSSRPVIAVDGDGAVHAAWVSTLPYSGHAAVRESGGDWVVREGAYGQARTVSLAPAERGVHALVDALESGTVLRTASGAELAFLGMSGASRRSIATGGDGRAHVLLETLVAEPCQGLCAVSVLYRQGVARASGAPEELVPEMVGLGEVGSGAIDVAARADGSAAFLYSIDGVTQVLDSEGRTRVLELPSAAYASALALGTDGSLHVLAQGNDNEIYVVTRTRDGEKGAGVTHDPQSIASQCPTAPAAGELCEYDDTRYDMITLVESAEAAYLVARASRTAATLEYRCGLPGDLPNATYCDWRTDQEPDIGLWIVRLSSSGPNEGVLLPTPGLPIPWMVDGTAVGRSLHLVVLSQPGYGEGCAATEVEIDCAGL